MPGVLFKLYLLLLMSGLEKYDWCLAQVLRNLMKFPYI